MTPRDLRALKARVKAHFERPARLTRGGVEFAAAPDHEESYIETLRRSIVEQYADHPTGTGHSFGEILCHEIHENGLTFAWLAEKWGLSLATLGELIADHCRRLEAMPVVDHEWRRE